MGTPEAITRAVVTQVEEEDKLFADEHATEIFFRIFDTPSGSVDLRTVEGRARVRAAITDIVELGYSESAADYYVSENLSECEPAE